MTTRPTGTVHGGDDKAIYAYAVEDYDWWATTTGPLDAGRRGEPHDRRYQSERLAHGRPMGRRLGGAGGGPASSTVLQAGDTHERRGLSRGRSSRPGARAPTCASSALAHLRRVTASTWSRPAAGDSHLQPRRSRHRRSRVASHGRSTPCPGRLAARPRTRASPTRSPVAELVLGRLRDADRFPRYLFGGVSVGGCTRGRRHGN